MDANEALIHVEEGIAKITTPSWRGVQFRRYVTSDLPAGLVEDKLALIDQGFDAGYKQALKDVSHEVTEVQNRMIRERPTQEQEDYAVDHGISYRD